MPELPDITIYREALERRLAGRPLERIGLRSPFVLRTVEPPLALAEGRTVSGLGLLGKRIVLDLGDGLFLTVHLMIAGRLRWLARGARGPGRITLATLDFPNGTLVLTEAGSKRRAAIHLVRGPPALQALDRGEIDVLAATVETFSVRLRAENHTLKRALTDPRLFSGIGNAYSDEILHAARLSPLALTSRLTDEEVERLHAACRTTLLDWIGRLRAETGDG